ncbi:MAG: heme lyase CcmF/NrfE family subunit [SAR92 clade bacterium]|uniref:Heme lyase CcmF/NrfE family subunit n=1 Tax=SAR92 clade bacterium TaxID=2315479 RepID=A0A520LNL0_9GAMM|nr:MAG: heme lyase CcmF/NrfE family subunit [SAR92 clade bacterium]
MIAEIGQLSLILALCTCALMLLIPILSIQFQNESWLRLSAPLALNQLFFACFSFVCLSLCFVFDDFSVKYVAQNSNSLLPLIYKVSAVWGAHEGSLLLWILVLSGWTAAVAFLGANITVKFRSHVLSVLAAVSISFLLFLILTSNPFDRILPIAPEDGGDLNPLLQDFGLIVHPPLLYMGYVGLAVPFAFAVALLFSERYDKVKMSWCRPWINVSWAFLTVGITLGSWWAYYELGWGGWWFWDPVENASLMPWLVATALMHSASVSEKKGTVVSWTILLAILAFSLSLLGTFLVRSGILTSVHAFASDPERGIFLLIIFIVLVGSSLFLFALKGHYLVSKPASKGWTREFFIIMNNMLLVSITTIILIGTLYPLLSDILNLGKISVGPPYFDFFFVPTTIAIAVFMGMSVSSRWNNGNFDESLQRVVLPGFASIALGLVTVVIIDFTSSSYDFSWQALITVMVASWIVFTLCEDIVEKIRSDKLKTLKNKSYLGMTLAHTGLALLILGVGLSNSYSVQSDLLMSPGKRANVAGYDFLFKELIKSDGPNYQSRKGIFEVSYNDRDQGVLIPEKRSYFSGRDIMTEAGIRTNILKDIYVSLGESVDSDSWSVRLYVKPMVRFIWIGGFLIACGGILASLNRRNIKVSSLNS